MPNLVILRQTMWVYLWRPAGKMWHLAIRPSRSHGHWHRCGSISYLWLPISVHSNYRPISYRFQ